MNIPEPICPECKRADHAWQRYNVRTGEHLFICFHCLADHVGNPRFVVRSKRHRRAVAHLSASISRLEAAGLVTVLATAATLLAHFWR